MNGGQSRNRPTPSAATAVTTRNPDPSESSEISKKISDLSKLKGIDKRLLDLILDNIYVPNSKVTFEDISGLGTAKQTLKEIGKLLESF